MYYEIYADSLFLLNFTLNLYLLLLVNKSLHRTATRFRLFLGAVWGGAGYCLVFFLPMSMLVKIIFAAICVNVGSLVFVFRPSSLKGVVKLAESMFLYAFLLGGAFLMLMNHVKVFRNNMMSFITVIACGGIFVLIFYGRIGKAEKQKLKPCMVELCKGEEKIQIHGLIDTGNSLIEPISGKPVSVVDKEIFEKLVKEQEKVDLGFRVIPYRSVGCERGIMKGYEIPEIIIEQDGMKKTCHNIYVGVSEGKVSSKGSYQILVHPKLLQG
ncbi:MAG: sigma-E processing peptidase SpoIIGA [Lachnospiraceae bacterium]|nr:sigma-E processing peptidase SpoIIGA [Lachnospiraceae bacterium]